MHVYTYIYSLNLKKIVFLRLHSHGMVGCPGGGAGVWGMSYDLGQQFDWLLDGPVPLTIPQEEHRDSSQL